VGAAILKLTDNACRRREALAQTGSRGRYRGVPREYMYMVSPRCHGTDDHCWFFLLSTGNIQDRIRVVLFHNARDVT